MGYRDSAKNGNHNLGGTIREMHSARFHMADGGSVSVPIPKLDQSSSRDASKSSPKPQDVPEPPRTGRNIFDVVRDRGSDLMNAEDRMVKGKADGGKVRLADGGDPFKSNDDGGGGAWAARQDYEAAQKPSVQPLVDRDTAEGGTGAAMDAAAMGPPAPVTEAAGPPEPAPSAMPKEVTTLTPAEKAGAAAGSKAAVADKNKERRDSIQQQAANLGGFGSAMAAKQKADRAMEADAAKPKTAAPASGGRAAKGKEIMDSIKGGLSAVGKALTPKAQRNKGYTKD